MIWHLYWVQPSSLAVKRFEALLTVLTQGVTVPSPLNMILFSFKTVRFIFTLYLTSSKYFPNLWHSSDLHILLLFYLLIPHSYLDISHTKLQFSTFPFPYSSTMYVSHLHYINTEASFLCPFRYYSYSNSQIPASKQPIPFPSFLVQHSRYLTILQLFFKHHPTPMN